MDLSYFPSKKKSLIKAARSSKKADSTLSVEELRKSHGQFWKDARETSGLTQAEVALALGYKSGQFISNVESGRCRYPGHQLPKIQKLYSLKTTDVLRLVLEEEELALRQAFGVE